MGQSQAEGQGLMLLPSQMKEIEAALKRAATLQTNSLQTARGSRSDPGTRALVEGMASVGIYLEVLIALKRAELESL